MTEQNNRIFVVDDEEMMRESLCETLSFHGFTVESADSGEKTLLKIKKWPVDLFLIDIRMPGMSGIELLKKLDLKNNTYEVIIISAYGDMDSAKEAMQLGAFSYLSKPVAYRDLAPVIKKALEIVKLKKQRLDHTKELEEKVRVRTEELEKENKKLKLVEGILRESEERYRNLFEQAPVGIGLATLDGKVVLTNRKMADITGYSSEELEKINLSSTYESLKDRKKLFDLLERDGVVNDFSVRLKRKNGTLYDAELSVSKVHIGGQDLIQTICVDVTERRKAEEALRESEEKYSTLVEQSKDAVLIVQDGVCIFANKATTDITGYTMKDLSGDNFWNFLAPESRERVAEIYKKRMAGKKVPSNYEATIIHKDGSKRYAEITVSVIQYKGKPAVMGTVRDVTERTKTDKAIKKSEERYQKLFEESNDAVFIHNAKGEILDVNKAACEMLGYDRNTLTVLKIQMLHPPKEHLKAKNALKNMAKTKKIRFESKFKRADGTIIDVEISARIIENEETDDNLIQGIVRDITEKKKSEEILISIKNKYESLMEHTDTVIFEQDKQLKYTFVHNSHPGFIKESVVGKTDFDLLPKEDAAILAKIKKNVLKDGNPRRENVITTINNKKYVYDLIVQPLKDKKGEVIGITCGSTDITEKKKAEETLRENERKLSEQNVMLQEKNIALREIMDQLEAEKDRLGKQINTNVDRLLLPLVAKLRSKGSSLDKTYIDLLEENVKELASQFGGKLSDKMLRLSQKEIEMCTMIKQGLTSKEIAKLLDISHRTVETHRNNIRKKLGIGKQEVNLVTYLKNM